MADRAKIRASRERRRRARQRPHTNPLVMAFMLTMIFVISLSKLAPGESLDDSQLWCLAAVGAFVAAAFWWPVRRRAALGGGKAKS